MGKFFKPYAGWMTALAFLVWGQSQISLALPGYTAKIVDEGILQGDVPYILHNGLFMLGITLLGGILAMAISFLSARIAAGFSRRVREGVFAKVESFSLNEFNAFSSSSLITRATNDIQQVQNILTMLMRMSLLAPFMGIGAVIKASNLAAGMSWIMLGAVAVLAILIIVLLTAAIPNFKNIQKLVDQIGLQTKEILTGVRVIRAYNKDEYEQDKFGKTNEESIALNIYVHRMMGLMQPVMMLVMGITSVAVVWTGAYMVGRGELQIGNVMALIQYVAQAIMSFLMFSIIFIMVPRGAVSARRINEVLNTKPEIEDPEKQETLLGKNTGRLEFKKVTFCYKGSEQPVLSDISFTAEPGQTTAIIGGTGSGKSTLINLIPRLYDVTCGSITIDGVDIRHIKQESLHNLVAYVPQKAQLLAGTIESNLRYGKKNASETELKKALEIAQLKDFELGKEVAQGGDNLSGGQKQRLAIARAIVKNAAIYLFDDSFSALDFRTDAALRKALDAKMKNTCRIIVGQRISSIMNADKIIVLDNGSIAGMGKHKALLKSCPVYKEIAESQLSPKELKEEK